MNESNQMQQYLQLAASPDADDRAEAARELKNFLRNDQAWSALVDLLGDADWRVRRAAVESLIEMRPHQAIPSLLMALYDEENAGRRNAAIDVLVHYGREILAFLQPHLNSENLDVHMFLINILGDLRDDSFLDFINGSLDHPDTNIASSAILALGKIGHPESVVQLKRFLDGNDLWLTFQAIEASGEMQDSSLIPELARLYGNPQYKKTIIHALSRFHHPAAYQALTEALVTKEAWILMRCNRLLDLYLSPAPTELKKEEQRALRDELRTHLNDQRVRALLQEYDRAPLALRKQLIQILGLAQSLDAIPLFLQELHNPELQECAVQALFDCDREAASLMLQRLQEDDVIEEEQGLNLAILAQMSSVPAVPNHQKWLGHENPEIRLQAFRLLARTPVTGVDQWLVGGALDPYVPIQDFCREPLLERCRKSKSLSLEVSDRMRERIHSEDPAERAAALEILIRLEGETSFPFLFEALKDEDALVRQKAVALMSTGYHHEFQKFLIAALADEDARVREQAARALSSYNSREVVDALVSSMHDEALWVRIATCESLAGIGTTDVIPAFLHQVETETPIGRAVLLRCLGQFRHSQTKETLLRYLNSEDPEIRKSSCESLQFFNDSDIVFRLFTLLQNDPDWGVRVCAVRSLTTIRPFRLQEALLERLRIDTDPFVRKEILASLQKLGIDHPPQELYEFLLDNHLADTAYDFLVNSSQKFAKQIQEASANQSPAIRRILKTIVS